MEHLNIQGTMRQISKSAKNEQLLLAVTVGTFGGWESVKIKEDLYEYLIHKINFC